MNNIRTFVAFHAKTFDGLDEYHCGLAFEAGGLGEGGIHLARVVTAPGHLPELLVGDVVLLQGVLVDARIFGHVRLAGLGMELGHGGRSADAEPGDRCVKIIVDA